MRDLSSCSVSKASGPLAYDISPVKLISHCVGTLKIRLTFCFRHATQAVILRVISGGLRSPNDSRKALTAGGEGNSISMIVDAVMQQNAITDR